MIRVPCWPPIPPTVLRPESLEAPLAPPPVCDTEEGAAPAPPLASTHDLILTSAPSCPLASPAAPEASACLSERGLKATALGKRGQAPTLHPAGQEQLPGGSGRQRELAGNKYNLSNILKKILLAHALPPGGAAPAHGNTTNGLSRGGRGLPRPPGGHAGAWAARADGGRKQKGRGVGSAAPGGSQVGAVVTGRLHHPQLEESVGVGHRLDVGVRHSCELVEFGAQVRPSQVDVGAFIAHLVAVVGC